MKMNQLNFSWLLSMMISSLFLISCNRDDENPTPTTSNDKFVYINNLGQSSYLGTFKDLSLESTDNKNSFEFPFGIYAFVYQNNIFVADGNFGDKITKFTRSSNGKLSMDKAISFPQGSQVGEISFYNENTAFASLKGRGKIGIFNPKTMEIKGEIDLSNYALQDNNPDPGANIIRDNRLYVALNQLNTTHTSVPGAVAQVAIINLENNTIEKVIDDDRVRVVGTFRHSKVIKDEKGDIYFYSQGVEGIQPLKDGFVRIKKNSTVWDTNYFFKPSETSIEGLSEPIGFMLSFFYAGNGIAYSSVMLPLKSSTPPDFINDKNFQVIKIDLWNKKIEKLNFPLSTSMGAFAISKQGDKIIFGLATENGIGYYTYNTKTEECTQKPVTGTVGVPSDLITFE